MIIVSVIVPCRNEKEFIAQCLDSIIMNDYPKINLEVIVVDGASNDGTKDIVNEYCRKYSYIHILDNQKKIQSAALNIGIMNAKGEIIIRMDAHNRYEEKYISNCLKYLHKYKVDNVGGVCVTLPGKNNLLAKSIALGLSHPFGVGNSYFRIGTKEPKYVDTVPFGCFRREIFNRIGLFDEDLVRNQDDEFNLRIIKNGGKILLVPEIVSYYYARESLLKLWRMYYQYGYFKPLVVRKIGAVLTMRQLIPSIFIASLLFSGIMSLFVQKLIWVFLPLILTYMCANLAFSFLIALNKGFIYMCFLPIVFSTLHFSYGLGYLKGVLDFILLKGRLKNLSNVPLTR